MLKRLLFLILLIAAPPLAAQPPEAALRAGGERVVALLKGEAEPAAVFNGAFLASVPEEQVRAIARQFAQYGQVRGLERVEPVSPQFGRISIRYERALLRFDLVVEPAPPHRVSGLLLTGTERVGDSVEAVVGQIRALPGQTNLAVARLGGSAPASVASLTPEQPLAIGSTFKLWILAELSRQVQAGQRRWSDVVPLDRSSFSGGTIAGWPRGAPATLHTLASLMISISDNSATDILLHLLGREAVERMMTRIGVTAGARNRPFLSTLEAALIKTADADAFGAWLRADEAGRRRLLAADYAATDAARVDTSRFAAGPLRIASVEWFASADDLVRTLDWLRMHGDDTARAILAINPGMPPRTREAQAYVGFKGGSEPGVISLSYLVRTPAGAWYAVTASWNNVAVPVDEARFAGLLDRLVALLR